MNNAFYLIAEVGVNHFDIAKKLSLSNLEAAKIMIDKAKEAGIHAIKFQTYKANTIASKNSPAYWDTTEEPTQSQYELFQKFDSFNEEEYAALAHHCKQIGIDFFSTPFDFDSADYLNKYMGIYKISSSDITNLPFIEHIALKNKRIILSVGASTLDEIKIAVSTIENAGNKDITLLHCVLSYPTQYKDANLLKIKSLKEEFPQYEVGLSDHTKPDDKMLCTTAAYIMGATVIEKHYTLDKTLVGNDHYHAMTPDDAKILLENVRFIDMISGSDRIQPLDCEKESRKQARRSIVAKCDIDQNDVFSFENLIFKRPGSGISPSDIDKVLGKKAAKFINEDELIDESMLQD